LAKRRPVPKVVRTMASGVQPRPAGFVGPMPTAPRKSIPGRKGIGNQYSDPIGPLEARPPVVPVPPKASVPPKAVSALRKLGKFKGLGLSALGIGAGLVGAGRLLGDYRENMIRSALLDIQKGQDDLRQREMMRQAQAASYEDAIGRNLRSLQQSAPDLYASVAAGRKLPQGGVVIGGAPRQDLLNELGRAMADGRFSR
jgi:hypothetical protein